MIPFCINFIHKEFIKDKFKENFNKNINSVNSIKKRINELNPQDNDTYQEEKEKLERIIHPLVKKERVTFLEKYEKFNIVGLDVPLLYETGMDKDCDYILHFHADNFLRDGIKTIKETYALAKKDNLKILFINFMK